jgi:hypothetical protein
MHGTMNLRKSQELVCTTEGRYFKQGWAETFELPGLAINLTPIQTDIL